jgi:hypothetical protein
MKFGSLNVRSLYRAGALAFVTRELAKYELHLVIIFGEKSLKSFC